MVVEPKNICPITFSNQEDGSVTGAACFETACAMWDKEDDMCVIRSILGELKLLNAALYGNVPGGSA